MIPTLVIIGLSLFVKRCYITSFVLLFEFPLLCIYSKEMEKCHEWEVSRPKVQYTHCYIDQSIIQVNKNIHQIRHLTFDSYHFKKQGKRG